MPKRIKNLILILSLLYTLTFQLGDKKSSTFISEEESKPKKFQTKTFRCLMKVAYQRLLEGSPGWKPDRYTQSLLRFLKDDSNDDLLKYASNIKLQKDFNKMMLNYDLYKKTYQDSIKKCKLEDVLNNTQRRCFEKYGDVNCMQTNSVSFGKKCPDGYINYKNYFCLPKCPDGFREENTFCSKGNHKKVNSLFKTYVINIF